MNSEEPLKFSTHQIMIYSQSLVQNTNHYYRIYTFISTKYMYKNIFFYRAHTNNRLH